MFPLNYYKLLQLIERYEFIKRILFAYRLENIATPDNIRP